VNDDEDDLSEDVHFRLMKRYPEVPEWWFGILLVIAMAIGMVSVGVYPTNTSPAVVVYGIIMPLIAILPCGYVQAVTGVAIPLQVLAQFIGGAFSGGNGVALMFFKVSLIAKCQRTNTWPETDKRKTCDIPSLPLTVSVLRLYLNVSGITVL
jgi:hypothetical protein